MFYVNFHEQINGGVKHKSEIIDQLPLYLLASDQISVLPPFTLLFFLHTTYFKIFLELLSVGTFSQY